MQLNELAAYTNRLLAVEDFNDYCPNGLQVQGRPEVHTLIGGVTACQALLDIAVEQSADAVLVHHGYFWKGEDPRIVGMKHRRLATLLRHDVSLMAYHLPLDAHPELGNNAQLAQVLDLTVTGTTGGNGRTPGLVMLGEPAAPMQGETFAAHIESRLRRKPLHISGSDAPIHRLAWCTGGAQSCIEMASQQNVDAFLTGEASEQTVHFARENNLHFFAAGHHATERYGIQALGTHLATQFGLKFTFVDVDNPV
ncbi:MAG TPA: Nif3-like dinuclear metal center hexameric protein [Candidatus Competibacteraceae bacterium]|nr:Nif3-like dinuclear metal center hexameric protein [Candidatus Competibacteraceae bacterium]HRY17769.1 Nif3-like dinuclear metal center hexameric protein [Candidatus Competibacteraceae bacterium]